MIMHMNGPRELGLAHQPLLELKRDRLAEAPLHRLPCHPGLRRRQIARLAHNAV
jgi:hypothetical protein